MSNKWWGKMPFRLCGETRKAWNLLVYKKGLANLSPLTAKERHHQMLKNVLYFDDVRRRQRGVTAWETLECSRKKTYTSGLRESFNQWREVNFGSWVVPITFQYR